MMTSVWDSIQIKEQFGDCPTLREVIARVEETFLSRGEVVCEIRVNGMVLREDDEVRFATSQMADIHDLSITTHNPRQLIVEALESAVYILPGVQEGCVRGAEELRGAEAGRSTTHLSQALDACRWLAETVVTIRGASDGTQQPVGRRDDWLKAEEKLKGTLREVLAAFERRDLVLVSDLMEYEVTNSLEAWTSVLAEEYELRRSQG